MPIDFLFIECLQSFYSNYLQYASPVCSVQLTQERVGKLAQTQLGMCLCLCVGVAAAAAAAVDLVVVADYNTCVWCWENVAICACYRQSLWAFVSEAPPAEQIPEHFKRFLLFCFFFVCPDESLDFDQN